MTPVVIPVRTDQTPSPRTCPHCGNALPPEDEPAGCAVVLLGLLLVGALMLGGLVVRVVADEYHAFMRPYCSESRFHREHLPWHP